MSAFGKWFWQGPSGGAAWVASLLALSVGVHLLRKAKKNRAAQKGKPQEPVWWKAPERWVEDPELSGLFFAIMGSCSILQLLWQLGRILLQGNKP